MLSQLISIKLIKSFSKTFLQRVWKLRMILISLVCQVIRHDFSHIINTTNNFIIKVFTPFFTRKIRSQFTSKCMCNTSHTKFITSKDCGLSSKFFIAHRFDLFLQVFQCLVGITIELVINK